MTQQAAEQQHVVTPNTSPVPIIDFSPFDDSTGASAAAVAKEILEAARDTGFFYLSNHGIPSQDIDGMRELAKKFFSRQQEYKDCYEYKLETNAGYLGIAGENLNPNSNEHEFKEAFNIPKLNGRYARKEDLPAEFADEWELLQGFQQSVHRLLLRVLRAFTLAMKLPESAGGIEYFTSRHGFDTRSGDILRLLRYPPVPSDKSVKWTRAHGHSDYGSLTLLFQDEVGGLEALLRSGNQEPQWVPVPPIPNTIVVNTGDLMEFWTDGLLKSTAHRVVVPPGDASKMDRYSIAYFGHPEDNTPLTTLPSPIVHDKLMSDKVKRDGKDMFRGPTSTGGHKAMTAAEHLKMRLEDIH